jgi:glycosyltransferase involved in cell wall biosynthesis
MALVSVIIPAYNRGKHIQRAVQSVLAQTYADLEVVVVDDGSKDDTVPRVQEEARHDSRVRLIEHCQQKGAQAARNTGIREAKGEWIAFLDSDDYWLPDSLEARLSLMGTSRTRIVHSECYLLKSDNIELEKAPRLEGNAYQQLLRKPGPMYQSLLAARQAFDRIAYLDESIVSYQEWDTFIRLAKHYSFVFLAQPTFVYDCRNSDSISANSIREANGYKQVFTKHWRPILSLLGPWGLADHYYHAADLYQRAGNQQNSRLCHWAAVCLWPFSRKTFAGIVGESAHALVQRSWKVVGKVVPGRALK